MENHPERLITKTGKLYKSEISKSFVSALGEFFDLSKQANPEDSQVQKYIGNQLEKIYSCANTCRKTKGQAWVILRFCTF